jgi:transaldolase
MKFFIDTADIAEIRQAHDMGLIDGVTTNPSLMAKTGRKADEVMADILGLVKGPVSLEVHSTDHAGMMGEAEKLLTLGPQVVIKVPLTPDGLKSCRMLAQRGAKVNVTLCFTATQALLAAKAGASYISPFVGRIDDTSGDGMQLIHQIRQVYDNYGFGTEILAASLRHPVHVVESMMMGADCCTLPPNVLWQLTKHPLTDRGLEAFLKDWETLGARI